MSDLTEFTWIDTDAVHLVGVSANGFPAPLLAKAAEALSEAQGDALVKGFVDGLCGVSGCAVCHDRYQAVKGTEGFVEKARMKAKERHSLSDSDFAFPKERKEPLNDESHVRNAISRFSSVEGVSDEERKDAARRIMARAKHYGIDVSDDSDVAQAAKATVDCAPSEVQTHADPMADEPSGPAPDAQPEGDARHVSFPHNDESDGTGDTAPDTDLHEAEAESQTDDNVEGNAGKATGDGTGTHEPDGDVSTDEEESQTRDLEKDAPGSPAWEHKDVALGEKAESLATQLVEVIHTFTMREKAEGGASKSLRRTARTARSLLKDKTQLRKVAEQMPDTNELVKVLGEYDKARRAEKKAERKAEREKAEKKAAKAAKKAAKAVGSEGSELAKAREELSALQERVEKLAAEDGKRIPTSAAGPIAALRAGVERDGAPAVLKSFDDAIEEAQKSLESASSPMEREKARQDLKLAQSRRVLAKMVAQENGRERGEIPADRRFGRLGFEPLFKEGSTFSIGVDSGIGYDRPGRRI